MCHWHYTVYAAEGFDEELANFPFAGGVRADEGDRARVLQQVRRQVAGYANAHPEAKESLRIVEMSCNGPQRTIWPYAAQGERREFHGGWEGDFPGEVEEVPLGELPAAPEIAPPGPAVRPTALAASAAKEQGRQSRQSPPGARLLDGLAPLKNADELTPVTVTPIDSRDAKFRVAAGDGWERVRAHFASFVPDPAAQAKALERLETWARIASQDVEGGGRANDEEVSVRASTLYSLRFALRELEAATGKLLVGRDDEWAPVPVTSVASLAEVKAKVQEREEQGQRAAVYALDPDGTLGERLYPLESTPYKVWSMATANLVGEFTSADEAISCAQGDPDDLVAFLDEPRAAKAVVIYDPNDLTQLDISERRERLRRLGRWPEPYPREQCESCGGPSYPDSGCPRCDRSLLASDTKAPELTDAAYLTRLEALLECVWAARGGPLEAPEARRLDADIQSLIDELAPELSRRRAGNEL